MRKYLVVYENGKMGTMPMFQIFRVVLLRGKIGKRLKKT